MLAVYSLVPRPSHRPVFVYLHYGKSGEGRPGPFYHVSDVSVYLSRQRRGEIPIERMSLRPYLIVSAPSAGVLNVHKAINAPLLVQNEEHMHEMHYFDGGPGPPLSVYLCTCFMVCTMVLWKPDWRLRIISLRSGE